MTLRPLLLAPLVVLCSLGTLAAQSATATVRAEIVDASGATVAAAHVRLIDNATGVLTFDGTTDAAGTVVALQIPPGIYRLTASAPGFRTATVERVAASLSHTTTVSLTLQVGTPAQTIRVDAREAGLDRSTSDISTLLAPAEVQNLPLNTRNVENLLAFVPGVVSGGNPTTINTIQLSINGSRTLNTEVLLNGVSVVTAPNGQPIVLPSPDGIQELRVLTSNAPAEFGRTSGAVLTANTAGGTGSLHGTVYSLLRNEALNANAYFNKLVQVGGQAQPRGRNRLFQEGASLGGPIVLPTLSHGREQLFFFVNYDRQLQRVTSATTVTVPTAAQRSGDFSASTLPVYLPGTSTAPGLTTPRYPGNRITSGIDPAAARILSLLPLPNTPGTPDPVNGRSTGNYTAQSTTAPDQLRLAARVDVLPGDRDRLNLNVYRYRSTAPNPVVYGVPLLNTNYDCACSDAWVAAVEHTRTWTSTFVTDASMGFARNTVVRHPPGTGLHAAAALGIASLPLDQTPQITITGYNNLGADTNTNQLNVTNTFAPWANATRTLGPHTLHFGASLRKNQFNSYNPSASPNGSINFTGTQTNHGATGNPTTALADFLTGSITTASYQLPQPPTGRRNWNLAFFAQDDWRLTPRLGLNAGLRYEYESPVTIATDTYSRFDPNSGILLRAGVNASASLNIATPKADLSPRVGLAFSVNDKTVLRAAFGTFYGTIFQNLGGQVAFPGYDQTQTSNALGTATPQPFSLSQGLPLTLTPDLAASFAAVPSPIDTTRASNPYSIGGTSYDRLAPMPMVQQWSGGIQRELPSRILLEIDYVGNHALHLPTVLPVNLVPLAQSDAVTQANTTVAAQRTKPFPALQSFNVIRHVGMSNNHALQIGGRRQFSQRLTLLTSYTYAKSMDDGSSLYNFSAPNGTANAQYAGDDALRKADYAVSSIDLKHRATVALQYTTTGPWYARGWTIAPAFVGETGLPLNITQNSLVPNVTLQRPNGRVGSIVVKPYFDGAVLRYFRKVDPTAQSPSAYPLTPSGPLYATVSGSRTRILDSSLGTLPRNAARAFGVVQLDASLSRTLPLFRQLRLNLRLDAFNVLNHTNFTSPVTTLTAAADQVGSGNTFVPNFRAGSSSFGQITGTQPPRNLQLVGRIIF